MKTEILIAFPEIGQSNCLDTIPSGSFEIFDAPDGRSRIKSSGDPASHLIIRNNTQNPIHFLAIDQCLVVEQEAGKRCDCAIFNEKEICFAEIKDTNQGGKNKARKQAIKQLAVTLASFHEKGILPHDRTEALICLAGRKTRPSATASRQADVLSFRNNFQADLLEGNMKIFL